MTTTDDTSLFMLGDRGQTVDGSANDVRGRKVKDADDADVGTVADLVVDGQHSKVRFLLVDHGGILGFGHKESLVPVDAVTKVTDDAVFVDLARDRLASAPGYAPHLIADRPYHSSLYHHFGYQPYWRPGYRYPLPLAVSLAIFPLSRPQIEE